MRRAFVIELPSWRMRPRSTTRSATKPSSLPSAPRATSIPASCRTFRRRRTYRPIVHPSTLGWRATDGPRTASGKAWLEWPTTPGVPVSTCWPPHRFPQASSARIGRRWPRSFNDKPRQLDRFAPPTDSLRAQQPTATCSQPAPHAIRRLPLSRSHDPLGHDDRVSLGFLISSKIVGCSTGSLNGQSRSMRGSSAGIFDWRGVGSCCALRMRASWSRPVTSSPSHRRMRCCWHRWFWDATLSLCKTTIPLSNPGGTSSVSAAS